MGRMYAWLERTRRRRGGGGAGATGCCRLSPLLVLVLVLGWVPVVVQGAMTSSLCRSLSSAVSWTAWSYSSVASSVSSPSCVFYVQLDAVNTCSDFCQSLVLNTTLASVSAECLGVDTPLGANSCSSPPASPSSALCSDATATSSCCLCYLTTSAPTRAPTNKPARPTRTPTRPPTRAPTHRPSMAPSVPPVPLVPLDFTPALQLSLGCLGTHPSIASQLWGIWIILGVVGLSWLVEMALRLHHRRVTGSHSSRIQHLDNKRQRAVEAHVRQRLARVQSGSLYLGLPAAPTEPLVVLNPLALAHKLRPIPLAKQQQPPEQAGPGTGGGGGAAAGASEMGSKDNKLSDSQQQPREASKPKAPPLPPLPWSFLLQPPRDPLRSFWWRDLRFHLLNRNDLLSLCLATSPPSVLSCWDRRVVFIVVYGGLHLLAHLLPVSGIASSSSSSSSSSLLWALATRCLLGAVSAQALRRLSRSRFPFSPPVMTMSLSRLVLSRDNQQHNDQQGGPRLRARVASPMALLVAFCCPWLTSPALLLGCLALVLLLASYCVMAYQSASLAHACLSPDQYGALHDGALTFGIMAGAALLSSLLGDLLAFLPAAYSHRCLIMGWCVWDLGRWRLDLLLTLLAEEEDRNLRPKVRRLMRRYRARRGLSNVYGRGVEDGADYLRLGLPPQRWLHLVLLDFPLLTFHSYVIPKSWRRSLSRAGEVVSIGDDDEDDPQALGSKKQQQDEEDDEEDEEEDEDDEEEDEEMRKRRERRLKEQLKREERRRKRMGEKQQRRRQKRAGLKGGLKGADDRTPVLAVGPADELGDEDEATSPKARGGGSKKKKGVARDDKGAGGGQKEGPVVWVSTSAPLQPAPPQASAGGSLAPLPTTSSTPKAAQGGSGGGGGDRQQQPPQRRGDYPQAVVAPRNGGRRSPEVQHGGDEDGDEDDEGDEYEDED